MDKPISVGDLVVAVRDGGCGGHLGEFYTVLEIGNSSVADFSCQRCGGIHLFPGTPALVDRGAGAGYLPLSWLKRIPPLEELDKLKREQEITA